MVYICLMVRTEKVCKSEIIIIVGARTQICILGLRPYLMMWIHPRRSKRLDRLQNRGSRTERVEEYSSRRLSFSNRMNVGQASTWAT